MYAPVPAPIPAPGDYGTIDGHVVDLHGGAALSDVVVIATSPAMQQAQTALTDDTGAYHFSIAAGTYLMTFYYLDYTREHPNIVVEARAATTLDSGLDTTLGPHRPPEPRCDEGAAVTQADIDSLLPVAIAALATSPDAAEVRAESAVRLPILVVDHVEVDGQRHEIRMRDSRFVPASRPRIQYAAEHHPEGIAYLQLSSFRRSGACVDIGAEFPRAFPTNERGREPFSCAMAATFVKRDSWSLVRPMSMQCE